MSEPSIVYFAAPGTRSHDNTRLAKVARLCDALGLKKIVSEINPEWTLNELQEIEDPKILARSKQFFGLKNF